MKFFALACAIFPAFGAALVAEPPLEARQAPPAVVTAITNIRAAVQQLTNFYLGISTSNGSDINGNTFVNLNQAAISSFQSASSQLAALATTLNAAGYSTVSSQLVLLYSTAAGHRSAINAKTGPISSRSFQGLVRIFISSQSTAATNYLSLVRSRVPASNSATIVGLANLVTAQYQSILAAYPT